MSAIRAPFGWCHLMNGLTFPSMKTSGDLVNPLFVPNTIFRIPPQCILIAGFERFDQR